jgi:putative ABC transport system ATP-binding protein
VTGGQPLPPAGSGDGDGYGAGMAEPWGVPARAGLGASGAGADGAGSSGPGAGVPTDGGGGGLVLRVTGVRKAFRTSAGDLTVLDGVDLAVRPGEIVAIAGRSGSGKTVLLTLAAGWDPPDAGIVELPGGAGPPSWRDLAVVPQSLGLLDELTVEENIALPRRLDGSGPGTDVGELAARLGLGHLLDRFPSEVSLGERQRAALARAAVLAPRLLVADEPIAHQNRGWAEAVMAVIADLAAGGTACLLATHNELAFAAADRVLRLVDGRIEPEPAGAPAPGSPTPDPGH